MHPRPTPWAVVLRGVRAELGAPLPLVPLQQWVATLDALAGRATAQDVVSVVRFFCLSANPRSH